MSKYPVEVEFAIRVNDWDYLLEILKTRNVELSVELNEKLNIHKQKQQIMMRVENDITSLTEKDFMFLDENFPKFQVKHIKSLFVENHIRNNFKNLTRNAAELGTTPKHMLDIYMKYWHSGLYENSWSVFIREMNSAIKRISWKKSLESNSEKDIIETWVHYSTDCLDAEQCNQLEDTLIKLGATITYKIMEQQDLLNIDKPQFNLTKLYEIIDDSNLLESGLVRKMVKGIIDGK